MSLLILLFVGKFNLIDLNYSKHKNLSYFHKLKWEEGKGENRELKEDSLTTLLIWKSFSPKFSHILYLSTFFVLFEASCKVGGGLNKIIYKAL